MTQSIANSGLTHHGPGTTDDPSREFWPEIDTWWRRSPAWRVSLFVPVSRNVETDYRKGNFIPQVDFAWGKPNRLHTTRLLDENRAMEMKAMMLRGGYLHGSSLGDQGNPTRSKRPLPNFT